MVSGGCIVPPPTYFEKVQAVLKKHDILLDRRRGDLRLRRAPATCSAARPIGIKPDMMTMAKQLSAAYLPISALMINEKIYRAMVSESEKIGTFGHGFTYGGHPVSAAVALETLKIYEERDIVGHVRRIAPRFLERLCAGSASTRWSARRAAVGLVGALELVRDKATQRELRTGRRCRAPMSACAPRRTA